MANFNKVSTQRRATAASVLIVEDEAEIRRIVSRYLRHSGYQVKETNSGETAIEILKQGPVYVLIADQCLPGTLQGVDVLSYHRKISSKGCRILFTGFLSDGLQSVCQRIGAVYLEKPVSLDHIVRTIENSLVAHG